MRQKLSRRTGASILKAFLAITILVPNGRGAVLRQSTENEIDSARAGGWFEATASSFRKEYDEQADFYVQHDFNATRTTGDEDDLTATHVLKPNQHPFECGDDKDYLLVFDTSKWSANYAEDPFGQGNEQQLIHFSFQERANPENRLLRLYLTFKMLKEGRNTWAMGGKYGYSERGQYFLCLGEGIEIFAGLSDSMNMQMVLEEARQVIRLSRSSRLYTPSDISVSLNSVGRPVIQWTLAKTGSAEQVVVYRSYNNLHKELPVNETSWTDDTAPCGTEVKYSLATRSNYDISDSDHDYDYPLSKWSEHLSIVPTCTDPSPPPVPPPSDCRLNPNLWGVILYSESNYRGRCSHLLQGHPRLGGLPVGDNAVSSVRVNGQFQVRLYEYTDQQGRYVEVNHSESNLDVTSLGEQFSSVSIVQKTDCEDESEPGVFLYETPGFGGSCQKLDSDVGNLGSSAVGDNDVSSVRINGEYRLTLFEDADFHGRSDEINHDESNLDVRTLGNQYSSARVEGVVRCRDTSPEGVYVYSEKHYKGNCAYVNGDVNDFGTTPVHNDGPRSLRIVGPYYVKMYEHRNFQGRSDEFGTNQDDLTWRSLGNQYSSLRFFENNQLPTLALNQANSQTITQNDQTLWSNQQQWTFSGTASDADGSVSRVEFNCEGDSCNVRNQVVSGTNTWTYTRNGFTGRNRIYFHAFDDDGARSRTTDRQSVTLNVDLAQPVTVMSLNGEASAANWPSWFTGPVQVILSAGDLGTGRAVSGIDRLLYRVDSGAWQTVLGSVATIPVTSDGSHTVEYYSVDRVGNQESSKSATFQIDQTPPSAPGVTVETHGVANDQWQRNQNVPTFGWGVAADATSGVWGYQLYFGLDPAGIGYQNVAAADPREWTPLPAGTRTGTYYLRGRTRDNAGNWSPWMDLFIFRFDGAPPENPGNATHAAGVANDAWQRVSNQADFTWSVPHDEGSGIQGYYLYWGSDPAGTTTSLITANQFQSAPVCGVDEACSGYLRLRSVDNVSNEAGDWTTAFVLRYDNVPPTVDFTFNGGITQTAQSQVTLFIEGQDQGSGVSEMRLSNDGVEWLPWEVYNTRRSWTIPAISRQWWPVYIQVRDGVGLESAVVTREVYLDVNPRQPRSTNFRLFDHIVSAGADAYTSASYQGRGTVGQSTDAARISSLRYTIAGGYEAGSQAIPIQPVSYDEYEYVNGIFASGVVATTMQSPSFQMVATVGELALPDNQTTLASPSFQHQPGFLAAAPVTTPIPPPTPGPTPEPPPAPNCSSPQVLIDGGAMFTRQANVTLSICAPYATEMMVSNSDTFVGAEWEPYSESKLWQLEVNGQQVLPRFVYVQFRASDGTVNSTYFDDIIYDPNSPSGEIMVGDSVPPSAFPPQAPESTSSTAQVVRALGSQLKYVTSVGESQLAQPLVLLSPNADGAVDVYIDGRDDNSGVTQMQVSEDLAFAGAAWEPFSPLKQWTPDSDGVKTLHARLRDDANNISSERTASFVYDSTPPIGAVATNRLVVGPATEAVEVYLLAEDELTGVSDMRLSTTADFSDAGWRAYSTTVSLPITATSESPITLYAQFRDVAGNASSVYSQTLAVDLTPPTVAVEVSAGDYLTRTVFIYAYDDLAGADSSIISNDPLMATGVTESFYANLIEWTFDDSRTMWVRVKDAVGNVSEPVAGYARITPVAPTIHISEANDSVRLNWMHHVANGSYEVWRSSEPYFNPDEPMTGTVKLATVGPPSIGFTMVYTDTPTPANEPVYYVVRGSNGVDTSAASNRMGRHVRPIVFGWNLVSWPMLPASTSLDSSLGLQFHGTDSPETADRVLIWNPTAQSYDSAWFCGGPVCESWGEPYFNHWLANDYSPSPLTLPPDAGFWIQNRSGATETLVILGEVAEDDRSVQVGQGWQLLGSAFPVYKPLDSAHLPATGTDSPVTADRVLYWDDATQTYKSAWYCGGSVCESWGEPYYNHWLANDYSPTAIVIQPGDGFWYQNRHAAFTWTNPFFTP